MNKSKFCPLPWIHLAIRNNGDFRVCCHANTSESRGTLLKNNGESYHLNNSEIDDSRNANLMKDIRRSMLEGEDHDSCIRCIKEESSNLVSRRQYENERWSEFINFDRAVEITELDGTLNVENSPLKSFDLRFGNKCNLKCRMCGPSDSDFWYNDYHSIWKEDSFKDAHGEVKLVQNKSGNWKPVNNDYSWIDNEKVWDKLSNNIDNVEHILVVGGEPLIVDEHYVLLERCISDNTAKDIVLEYNTNMVTIPERAWELWKHFKKVKIGMSIDAYGKANDYIRHPSKWEKIEKNILKIDRAEGNLDVWIASTMQAYNALAILDLMKWKLSANLERVNSGKNHPIITTHPASSPKYLSLKMFPIEVKKKIELKYREFYEWIDTFINENKVSDRKAEQYRKSVRKILEGYISFMNSEDLSDEFSKFIKYTARADQLRNERFDLVFPDLYEMIKPHLSNRGFEEEKRIFKEL